jgi:hypothetical protein
MTFLLHTRQRHLDRRHTAGTVIGLRMRACGLNLAVSAAFRYDTASPGQVRLSLQPGLGKPSETGLTIPRRLLAAGLNGPAYEGNVRTRPSAGGRLLVIRFSAPDGTAEFDAPAASIARFLDATCRLVPPGAGVPPQAPGGEQLGRWPREETPVNLDADTWTRAAR